MPNGSMIRVSDRPAGVADAVRFVFHGESFVLGGDTSASGPQVGYLRFGGNRYSIYLSGEPVSRLEPESPIAGPLTAILTHRELQIILMIAEGKCDKSIARELGISSYTVREYVRRSCGKLGVARRTALASTVVRALAAAAFQRDT